MLLAAGADINARVLAGTTPLHEAALAGHLEVVKALLERKDCT
jgi:ankyrin repeat protein